MEEPQPGFRFYPTEEELVSFYLQNKAEGRRVQEINRVIPVVDIYDYNPWELPQFAGEGCPKDTEQWFFFIPMQEREVRGGRTNRLTSEGYWKATGSPGYVYSFSDNPQRATIIGAKRTMVFYKGRAPNGRKTRWKMIEYKSILQTLEASSSKLLPQKLSQELSVCRVYIKSKCVRAFDRRPMPAAAAAAQQPHYCHGNLQLQTPELLPERRAGDDHDDSRGGRSSSSLISADDHYCYSHADAAVVLENGNWNLTLLMPPADNNSEPLWDWEHLVNWS